MSNKDKVEFKQNPGYLSTQKKGMESGVEPDSAGPKRKDAAYTTPLGINQKSGVGEEKPGGRDKSGVGGGRAHQS